MRLIAPLLMLLVAVSAGAREVPRLNARVTDEAGVLPQDTRARLEGKLEAYASSTGHQFAVLVIPSLDGDVLEQYALKVAEGWKLGDKARDDGLLLLVAMKERAIRIEVGYGLEGAVTDATSSRVIRDVMVPRFQAGDPAGGIEAGLDALMRVAAGESMGAAPRSRPPKGVSVAPFLFLVFFVLLGAPRMVRAPLFAVVGGMAAWIVLHSLVLGIVCAAFGLILGIVLPRGGRGGGGGFGSGLLLGSMLGGHRSSSTGFGGFSGGGGGFGGGGASGRW